MFRLFLYAVLGVALAHNGVNVVDNTVGCLVILGIVFVIEELSYRNRGRDESK